MAEMILEKLKNSKVLSGEVQGKLSSLINRYSELNDEEKSQFKENASDIFMKSLSNLLTNSTRQNKWLTWLTDSRVIFLLAILIVIFIFVFFGYKLYKSLSERERKREEKRKLKQMKKKK